MLQFGFTVVQERTDTQGESASCHHYAVRLHVDTYYNCVTCLMSRVNLSCRRVVRLLIFSSNYFKIRLKGLTRIISLCFFLIITEASSDDCYSDSTRSGFITWCGYSPLPITVCVYSKLAVWAGIAQFV
jgi:hypothetical protein